MCDPYMPTDDAARSNNSRAGSFPSQLCPDQSSSLGLAGLSGPGADGPQDVYPARRCFDVRDFGAVADGVTNDQDAARPLPCAPLLVQKAPNVPLP